jgi:hypothetical protein
MHERSAGFSPWEVEAARRREVVESDFDAAHGSRREGAATEAGAELHDRAGARSAIVGPAARHASPRSEPVSRCRPGVTAIEPGA